MRNYDQASASYSLFQDKIGGKGAIYGGNVEVWTSNTTDGMGLQRYLLFASTLDYAERLLPDLLDSVARIEMYRHKTRYLVKRYREEYDGIEEIEDELSAQVDLVVDELEGAKTNRLEFWLTKMQEYLGSISKVHRERYHDLHTVSANVHNLELQIQDWGEARAGEMPQVSAILLQEGEFAKQIYSRLLERIEQMLSEIETTIMVLRSRVELGRQELEQQGARRERQRNDTLALIAIVLSAGQLIQILPILNSNENTARTWAWVLIGPVLLVILYFVVRLVRWRRTEGG